MMQMIINFFYKAFFLISTIPFLVAERVPQSKKLALIPHYQDSEYSGPKAVGGVENQEIDEASGLAFSRTMPGIIYTHNDSGGEPMIYMMDTLGKDKGAIKIEGVKNRDWEDVAVGPGDKKDISYVYIGEIGDNDGKYSDVKIFRFPEPKHWRASFTVQPEVLTLTYPDGPRDAETLLVDPVSTDIFILSKRDSTNILYKVPQSAFEQGEFEMERVMDLPITMSVAGDISADGSQILIKTYFAVFYWKRERGESIPEALKKDPLILPYKPEPQGEAIGFHPSGKSYFTVSETRFGIKPELYRYDKK
jgi:hypothetical protein